MVSRTKNFKIVKDKRWIKSHLFGIKTERLLKHLLLKRLSLQAIAWVLQSYKFKFLLVGNIKLLLIATTRLIN
jgi:hypothetical protein